MIYNIYTIYNLCVTVEPTMDAQKVKQMFVTVVEASTRENVLERSSKRESTLLSSERSRNLCCNESEIMKTYVSTFIQTECNITSEMRTIYDLLPFRSDGGKLTVH